MKAGQQRLNRWNTTNSSFQNRSAENRPTSSQKVIESRQESTRYDRLRRVKSAVGSQRDLNPNAERLLKRSKAKLKKARPARHFKAWDDREMPVPVKSEIHRKDKLKRQPTKSFLFIEESLDGIDQVEKTCSRHTTIFGPDVKKIVMSKRSSVHNNAAEHQAFSCHQSICKG